MHLFKVYFVNTKEPLIVSAMSFSEAEQLALKNEKFKEISRITKDEK